MIALATLAATAVGMFMPYINKLLFNDVESRANVAAHRHFGIYGMRVHKHRRFINAVKRR